MRAYLDDLTMVVGDGRKELPWLACLMVVSALMDLLGLGLIAPLIVLIAGAETATVLPAPLKELVSVDPRIVAVFVLAAFTLKMVVGYYIQKVLVQFSEVQRSNLMMRLMSAYLNKPYEYFLQRNSADVVNSVINTTWTFSTGTLTQILRLFADLAMFAAVVGFLAWVNWQIVALLGVLLGTVATIYIRVSKSRLAAAGELINENTARMVQDVNQGMGGIREIRILGAENYCLDQLRRHSIDLAKGYALYGGLSAIPRYLMEWTLIVGLLTMLLFVSVRNIAPADFIPIMGLIAVAAIRLMPGVMSIMAAVNSLRLNRYGLRHMAEELRANPEGPLHHGAVEEGMPQGTFESLALVNVTYRYANAKKPAVSDVSFAIHRGQAVGFIGRSGSGKSTTADILLGLLVPHSGAVIVNGKPIRQDPRPWMRRVSYIPQQIHLSDDSLLRNIAFGVEPRSIDPRRVALAVEGARLQELVASLPNGLDTLVGERGVRLSGGQRQRVALARAFYHDRDVIVMDEATAALDHETEQEVVSAIKTLHGVKTLIIIAHRLSTLEGCDLIFRFDHGRIVEQGTYLSVIGRKGTRLAQ